MENQNVKKGVFGSFVNNPDKIDSVIGWVIIAGLSCALAVILSLNLEPYQNLILAAGRRAFMLRMVLIIPGVSWILAVLSFSCVQFLEVLPLLAKRQFEDQEYEAFLISMMIRLALSIPAFLLDTFLSLRFFPVLNEGITPDMLFLAFNPSMVNWANCLIVVFTIFGLTLFIIIKRAVARVF